jgi:ABC-type polysaccharide/polyol phosphate export permease
LVNFLLALVVLFVVLFVFRVPLSPWLWQLPIVILLQTVFMIGLALFLATLNVFYRDTMLVMDVMMLAWFFLTPIFYSTSSLPQTVEIAGLTLDLPRLYFILNPMASIINMYRDLLYYGYRTDLDFFLRSAVTAFLALGFGYWFFTRYRGRFGEEL